MSRETFTGGTITIETGQSEVRSAVRLERIENNCNRRKVDVDQTAVIGGRAFRGGQTGSGF